MSIDKFTSRGFGGSGTRPSSWNGVQHGGRASYEKYQSPQSDDSPQTGRLDSPYASQRDSVTKNARRSPCDGDRGAILKNIPNVRGGDNTTTKWERRGIFIGMFLIACLVSLVSRGCGVQSSARDWIKERRSHITEAER